MTITYANTTEMENIASELSSLANNLDETLNRLYTRLGNVPQGSKEWIGDAAVYYFSKICEDKQNYLDFSNQIRDFSKQISSSASSLRTCMERNRSDERTK